MIPVSFTQAALGADGAGSHAGGRARSESAGGNAVGHAHFASRQEGRTGAQRPRQGDLFVEIRVQTPGKLSKRQRELLEELAKERSGRK